LTELKRFCEDLLVQNYASNADNQALSIAGAAERISVVRHAFASHDSEDEQLSDLVAALGEGRVAVAHDATQPHRRLVVDEYAVGADGQFQLQRTGSDLLR